MSTNAKAPQRRSDTEQLLYLHTMDGQPATWSTAEGELIYADAVTPATLVSRRQLSNEQRLHRRKYPKPALAGILGYVPICQCCIRRALNNQE